MTSTLTSLPEKSPSPYSVFRRRNFVLLWTSQIISTLGISITSLASSIYVYQETDRASSIGLMLMISAAASLAIGLLAGGIVDRSNRKRMLVLSDVLRGSLTVAIPLLTPLDISLLYLLVALTATVTQFYDPAYESILPETADEHELAAANSLFAISSFGSYVVGFVASGWIAHAGRIEWAFFLGGFFYLAAAGCSLLVKVTPLPVEEGSLHLRLLLRNIQGGIGTLWKTPVLRSLFLASVPVLIGFGLSDAIYLPFASEALGVNEFQYSLLESLHSLGFLAGSLLLVSTFDRLHEGPWIAISLFSMGLVEGIFALSSSLPFALVLVTLSGLLNTPYWIGKRLVIQRNTPREMRGRVNSAFFVQRDLLVIAGLSLAWLADLFNVRVAYLITAVLYVAGGVWVLFLPGLQEAAAEWRRALGLLGKAAGAPRVSAGRAAAPPDFNALAEVLPDLLKLTPKERESLVNFSRVVAAPSGTAILLLGEASDAAYFILSGKVVAGLALPEGGYRSLSALLAGDFFGEIAALTGVPRTADVVASEACSLLQVPASILRNLMANPAFSQLLLSRMAERLDTLRLSDLPRFSGVSQQDLKVLRSD